jgi:hypothetical protein
MFFVPVILLVSAQIPQEIEHPILRDGVEGVLRVIETVDDKLPFRFVIENLYLVLHGICGAVRFMAQLKPVGCGMEFGQAGFASFEFH